jgi:HEAT repeat protein
LAPLSDPGYRAVTPAWVVTPYEEWNLEKTAENSLGRIGESAVPALVRSLNHPDPVLRLRAAKILGRIGPEARSAVPQLVSTLRDPQLPVRKAAIWALGQIGPDAAEAVDPLLNVLNASATEDEPIQQTSLDRPAAGASAP